MIISLIRTLKLASIGDLVPEKKCEEAEEEKK
jgi:hypothetical protein